MENASIAMETAQTVPETPPCDAPSVQTLEECTQTTDTQIDKSQEVFGVAQGLFRRTSDWVTFFREILGVNGVARRTFSTTEEYALFEKTAEYEEILQMIAKLRQRRSVRGDTEEPTRVITVRMPKSLHELLRAEAYDRQTSMNKLCISKLLQVIDDVMIPSD